MKLQTPRRIQQHSHSHGVRSGTSPALLATAHPLPAVHRASENVKESKREPLALSRRDLFSMSSVGAVAMLQLPCTHAAQAALIEDDISMQVFEQASPSVVSIINYKTEGGVRVAEGVGTGVVWDKLGHVATNYHVISGVDKSTITQVTKVVVTDAAGNTTPYSVELMGADAMHDLAVLRMFKDDEKGGSSAPDVLPILMGSSADLKVGQNVFAIGNTFGQTKTLSAGIVSGLNRTIPSPVGTRIYGAVQTDTSINAGNSGGPLLDSSGRMVGMNTATYSRAGSGRGSGVNFALPADTVMDIVPKLIVYGNAMGRRV